MCTALTYQTAQFYFGRTLDYDCSYGETVTVTPRRFPLIWRHGGRLDEHHAMRPHRFRMLPRRLQ